jgi:hypothetical protein
MLNGIQHIQQSPTYRPVSHSPVSLTPTGCRIIYRDTLKKAAMEWCKLLSRPESTAQNSETFQGSRCTVRDPNKAPAAYKTKDTAEPVMITSQWKPNTSSFAAEVKLIDYNSVSQTVVRGPQVVLGFCPCGPLRLNISPKKTEKIKLA